MEAFWYVYFIDGIMSLTGMVVLLSGHNSTNRFATQVFTYQFTTGITYGEISVRVGFHEYYIDG